MSMLIPSILENSKESFVAIYSKETKLPSVSRIQVDFCDGVFVSNTTVPIEEIDVLNPAFHWEAHLMTFEPEDFLDYKIAGFNTIIIHYEAYRLPTQLRIALQEIQRQGMEPAICIKPETDIAVLKDFEAEVKNFQLMSVHPGFQGTEFLEESYQRIAKLKKLCPNVILEVDGGVNETNIKKVAVAGADYIVLGSALTKAPDMVEAFEKLHNITM